MEDTVLIVDDDKAVSKLLGAVMKNNGLGYEIAESGEEALLFLKRRSYSLMILDINMYEMDGFDVLRAVRGAGNQIPVIIVSGRREDQDTLHGLDLGADEYITKPFNPVTLGASVKALIRRSKVSVGESQTVTAGPFSFNTSTFRLYKGNREIVLSGKECAMMKLFLDNVNRVFSKKMLYDMVWGSPVIDENAVMVYINRLRQKIEDVPEKPKYIQTIRSIGYRFVV